MTDAATANPARRAALWWGALMLGLLLHVSPAKTAAYLSAVEDMPLMPGLTEQKDSSFMFDAPDGRIVRAGAHGPVAVSDAAVFYKNSLPSLGWKPTSARSGPKAGEKRLTFAREGERLEIDVLAAKAGMTEVHFSIDPE